MTHAGTRTYWIHGAIAERIVAPIHPMAIPRRYRPRAYVIRLSVKLGSPEVIAIEQRRLPCGQPPPCLEAIPTPPPAPVMGTHPNVEMNRRGSRPSRTQVPASDRSSTTVVRPRRLWRSARASEPRENQPARQIAVESLPASSDQMVS
jgi:hypothetical protein